jgi:hypothetical protein
MSLIDPLQLLKRTDKWYLGNGGMLIYAPPFPQHLHVPGFWDECHFGDLAVPRLLCVSVAMEISPTEGRATGPARGVGPVDGPAGSPTPSVVAAAESQHASRALLPLDPYFSYWHWQPDGITARYYLVEREGVGYKQQAGVRIFMEETRRIGPDGTLHCSVRFEPMPDCPPTKLHVVGWTARQHTGKDRLPGDTHADFFSDGQAITYKQAVSSRAHARGDKPLTLQVTMTSTPEPDSLEVTPSHGASLVPKLQYTPLWDSLRRGLNGAGEPGLRGEVNGVNLLGSVVYAGLHWRVDLAGRKFLVSSAHDLDRDPAEGAGTAARPTEASIDIRVNVRDPRDGSRPVPGQLVAGGDGLRASGTGREGVSARSSSVSSPERAAATEGRPPLDSSYHQSLATPDPTQAWREFMSLVPHFECSDPMLTRYYWYRWYGLRLNALPSSCSYRQPAVAEGIAYFRGVISYSLMCHVREARWLSDSTLAAGCLLNQLQHQTRSGHFAAHIYAHHVNSKGFYHTDVGRAVRALEALHPDPSLREELRPGLTRLLDFYCRERDKEGLNLYDLHDQYETGQEFTSRYFHADEKADQYGWENKLRLKGVDVCCYVFHLAELLRDWALERGDVKESQRLSQLCELIRIAIRQFMWDPGQHFFFDYSAVRKQRSPYWSAVGFYPLLSSLATDEMAMAVGQHLLPDFHGGTGRFDSPWTTPTIPANDPYFSAAPYWRAERANCPWNGRVWPMVNSHIVDVLARLGGNASTLPADPAALKEELPTADAYRSQLVWYIRRWIELMHFEKLSGQSGASAGFGEKDLSRPNCFEHYSPEDGTACEYRGIDDYMHSWVADCILKHVCGVRITDSRATVPGRDPQVSASRDASATGSLVIDPLEFGLSDLLLLNCHVRGHRLDLCWNRARDGRHLTSDGEHGGWRVFLDGELVFRADRPQRWECALD